MPRPHQKPYEAVTNHQFANKILESATPTYTCWILANLGGAARGRPLPAWASNLGEKLWQDFFDAKGITMASPGMVWLADEIGALSRTAPSQMESVIGPVTKLDFADMVNPARRPLYRVRRAFAEWLLTQPDTMLVVAPRRK